MGLFDNVLEANQSLFKDEAALDYEFLPKLIPYRESEQQYLARCIKPLFHNRSGRNVLVYGAPGIGKTAAIRHVLRDLEDETDDVYIVYCNCWKQNTTYKVLVEVCEQLGYRFTQNKKTTELLSVARELINKKSAVLVFDEIDKAEDFDFLYSLIEEIYRKTILLITNYKSWLYELDERIRSRLLAELVEFKPYNQKECLGILQERIKYALIPTAITTKTLDIIATKTYQLKDIRSGLFLLKESALLAEEESSKVISADIVSKAIAKLDEFSSKRTEELDEESRFVHNIISQHNGKKIGDLFKAYQHAGGNASYKTFQRRINKLEEGNFIKLTKQTGAGGNTTIVEKKLTDF
ncbi:MAG: Cdc6/Cdc18 family protein [Candidatus Woesearchaeota archaeon]